MSNKDPNLSMKFLIGFFSVSIGWKQKNIPVNWEITKYKTFLIKFWLVFFIIVWFRLRDSEEGILGARRIYERWSDIEVDNLPEIILGIAILEKTLSINVLELLVTTPCWSIWGRK